MLQKRWETPLNISSISGKNASWFFQMCSELDSQFKRYLHCKVSTKYTGYYLLWGIYTKEWLRAHSALPHTTVQPVSARKGRKSLRLPSSPSLSPLCAVKRKKGIGRCPNAKRLPLPFPSSLFNQIIQHSTYMWLGSILEQAKIQPILF